MPSDEHHIYHPKDAIAVATEAGLIVGGFGALFSGIQNTLARQNVGAKGFITRFGSTTTVFGASLLSESLHAVLTIDLAAMGLSYGFTKTFAANIRQKEDSWNTAIGGFFGGSMIGLRGMVHVESSSFRPLNTN
jgi:hypothetical protein